MGIATQECERCRGRLEPFARKFVPSTAAVVLAASVLFTGRAEAVSSNAYFSADFSGGFAGWTGQVTDLSLTATLLTPPPGAFPQNFDASSGAAVLTTSTAIDGVFSVFLFREIVLPLVAPGQALTLSYDFSAVLSDAGAGDAVFSQFGALSLPPVSVTGLDITALAGQTLDLIFGVEDFDDIADTLTVNNIAIHAVPLPAALPLFATGLLGLAGVAWRRRDKRDGV